MATLAQKRNAPKKVFSYRWHGVNRKGQKVSISLLGRKTQPWMVIRKNVMVIVATNKRKINRVHRIPKSVLNVVKY